MQFRRLYNRPKLARLSILPAVTLAVALVASSVVTPLPTLAQGPTDSDSAGQIFLPFVSSNQDISSNQASQSSDVPETSNMTEVSAAVVNGKLVTNEPSWIVFAPRNCTAVLVHPQWIMSAGHCNKSHLLDAGTDVYIGGHSDRNGVKAQIVKSFVLGWTPHTRDLALFKLNRAVKNKPVKMARNDVVDYGTKVIVYGYGFQNSTSYPDEYLYKTGKLSVNYSDKLGYEQTTSTGVPCNGDSGAPVVLPKSKLLVGLHTGEYSGRCASGSQGVGVELFHHIDWIDETVNENGGPGDPNAPQNIALGKSATSSSDREFHSASKAIDGDAESRWKSEDNSGNTKQWIQIDLGQPYAIDRVALQWGGSSFATTYKIQLSKDGRRWNAIHKVRNGDGDGDADDLTNLSGTGRYIRLLGIESSTNLRYALVEFEVYGTAQ